MDEKLKILDYYAKDKQGKVKIDLETMVERRNGIIGGQRKPSNIKQFMV